MARDTTLTPAAAAVLDTARERSQRTEELRQQMLVAAGERAAAIRQLHVEHGLSVRRIAVLLDVSAGTIQSAIERGGRA